MPTRNAFCFSCATSERGYLRRLAGTKTADMDDFAYAGINRRSTEQEKMNAVINFINSQNNGYSLKYERLHIPIEKSILFDKKLFDTGYVKDSGRGKENYPFFWPTDEGKLMLAEYGSYLAFLKTQEQTFNVNNTPSKNAAIAKVISLWKILSANPIAKWIFGILTILLCAYIIFRLKWN